MAQAAVHGHGWWIWVQVVYLSATSFLDKRTESEARKKFDAAAKAR